MMMITLRQIALYIFSSLQNVFSLSLSLSLSRRISLQLETLEKELVDERDVNERLSQQIRELEQDNDDLERAKRVLAASLEEFEAR